MVKGCVIRCANFICCLLAGRLLNVEKRNLGALGNEAFRVLPRRMPRAAPVTTAIFPLMPFIDVSSPYWFASCSTKQILQGFIVFRWNWNALGLRSLATRKTVLAGQSFHAACFELRQKFFYPIEEFLTRSLHRIERHDELAGMRRFCLRGTRKRGRHIRNAHRLSQPKESQS